MHSEGCSGVGFLGFILLVGWLLHFSPYEISAQVSRHRAVRGIVIDSATQQPIRFATVRLEGTSRGAMTSHGGSFVIVMPDARDTAVLVVSMVGYQSSRVAVSSSDTSVRIALTERALRSAAVVVTAEDPAYRIMRKVIRRKADQDSIQRYTYMLYTKFVATTDTVTASRSTGRGDSTVFSILESYSKGYVKRPDKYFNEIIQRRQTANIPPQANFVAFGTNLNAFDDEVSILNETIITPFSEKGLEVFDLRLTSDESDSIVSIDVRPRSSQRKAFEGTVWIDTRTHYPVEVRFTPSKAVNLPFDAKLRYRQTFIDVDGKAIMPEALSIMTTLQADVLFIISPRLDVTIETFCYDYEIGANFDDGIFDQRRVEILESAFTFDTTFWNLNERVPLREEERRAYDEIAIALENPDSLASATFIDRFLGPIPQYLARLGRRPFTGFEDIVRYNRVHGLYLGLGTRFRPDTVVEVYGTAGYGTSNEIAYGQVLVSMFAGRYQNWRFDLGMYHRLDRRDDPWVVRTPAITFTTLLAGNDYGDYYHSSGVSVGAGYSWGQLRFIRNDFYERPNTIDIWVRRERHQSVHALPVFTLAGRSRPFRENPQIDDGMYTLLGGRIHLTYHPQRMISRTGVGLQWELSDTSLFSARRYLWLHGVGTARIRTLPLWTLDVGLRAGYASGDVPSQRFFSMESSVSGLATANAFRGMSVKEFYGDRYLALSLAHNFGELVPGLLRIPNVASFGLEFLLTGSVGWSAFETGSVTTLPSTARTSDRWYYEAGIGVNRILLFFRLDVGARFSQREQPGFYVTLGAATF